MIIHISVKNRVATYLHTEEAPVCGNSTDQVKFLLDEEWSAHDQKTARFFWGNRYHEETFTGDTCPLPMFMQTNRIQIGVYAGVPMEGEVSLASTRATVPYLTSVHCTEAQPTAITVEGYVHEAKVAALESERFAEQATASAGDAQNALSEINAVIENTTNTANFALQEANTANAESADAKRRSEIALSNANEAKRIAQEAQTGAEAADTTANSAVTLANEAKELAKAAEGMQEVGSLRYNLDQISGFRISGTTCSNSSIQPIYQYKRFYDNEVNQQVNREETYVQGLKELFDQSKVVKMSLFYNNYNIGMMDIPLFSEWITDRTTTCGVADEYGTGDNLYPLSAIDAATPSKEGTKLYYAVREISSSDSKTVYYGLWLSELAINEYTSAMNMGQGTFDGYVTFTGYN